MSIHTTIEEGEERRREGGREERGGGGGKMKEKGMNSSKDILFQLEFLVG